MRCQPVALMAVAAVQQHPSQEQKVQVTEGAHLKECTVEGASIQHESGINLFVHRTRDTEVDSSSTAAATQLDHPFLIPLWNPAQLLLQVLLLMVTSSQPQDLTPENPEQEERAGGGGRVVLTYLSLLPKRKIFPANFP